MPFAGLEDVIKRNEPLAPRTSYRLGGPARWLARPRTVEQLAEIIHRCRENSIDVYTLGGGANLLVSDEGVDGMVIRLSAPAFRHVDWPPRDDRSESVIVTAGGGVDIQRLANGAVHRGLAGLECMAGIPGSLGGAIRMNAGGKFGQISDLVRSVTVLSDDGSLRTLTPEEIGFSYRHSNLGSEIICRVELGLIRGDAEALTRQFRDIWEWKKSSQPMTGHSAGCVFKNPTGHSAGALIDRAGLKGASIGGAEISPRHANFIVARSNATARDVLDLILLARKGVAEQFGVELELEIQLWGHARARRPEKV